MYVVDLTDLGRESARCRLMAVKFGRESARCQLMAVKFGRESARCRLMAVKFERFSKMQDDECQVSIYSIRCIAIKS